MTVTHRWNLPEGAQPPMVGDTIRGASRAHSWRVVELIPIESRIHLNAFRGVLEPLGPWTPADEHRFDRYYPNARERAQLDHAQEGTHDDH